ncbi:MAG: hypothetical protein GXO63_02895 [Candidatus Micrarchaeota archaeon]|nr:hypothetical protein [Candidatus Micrarchaeota archaeon]
MRFILVAALILLFLLRPSYACGCGFALVSERLFESLEEPYSYLIVEGNSNGYNITLFFRLISKTNKSVMPIVFPIKDIPSNVTGKTISRDKFLSESGLEEVEKKEKEMLEYRSLLPTTVNLFVTGYLPFLMQGPPAELVGIAVSPVARFKFEGGSLEIYNLSGGVTLDELVKSLNITVSGKVKKLVEKYRDYYVAVLRLEVPSVNYGSVGKDLMACIPDKASLARAYGGSLEENALKISDEEISKNCPFTKEELEEKLKRYINALRELRSLKGTAITISFENTTEFFYPISIVNSYNSSIKDERYYVKLPLDMDAESISPEPSKVIILDGYRWYKITNTTTDLSGKIVQADIKRKIDDTVLWILMFASTHKDVISYLLFILLGLVPVAVARRFNENIKITNILCIFFVYFLTGVIGAVIMSFLYRKKILARIFLILLLIIFFIFIFPVFIIFILLMLAGN